MKIKKLLPILLVLVVSIALAACGTTTTYDKEYDLTVGDTTTWAPFTSGTTTFTSGKTAVATVDSATGVITGVAAGTADITAKNGSETKKAKVTVKAATAEKFDIEVGATKTWAPFTTGTTTFTSSKDTVATVDTATGVITGVAMGTAEITATNGTVTKKATITVIAATPVLPTSAQWEAIGLKDVDLGLTGVGTVKSSTATADSIKLELTGATTANYDTLATNLFTKAMATSNEAGEAQEQANLITETDGAKTYTGYYTTADNVKYKVVASHTKEASSKVNITLDITKQ